MVYGFACVFDFAGGEKEEVYHGRRCCVVAFFVRLMPGAEASSAFPKVG